MFFTGVTPVTFTDGLSSLNMVEDISFHSAFEGVCGFYERDVRQAIDALGYSNDLAEKTLKIIQDNFHGYRFNPNQVEGIFNPQSTLYYLEQLLQKETGINDERDVRQAIDALGYSNDLAEKTLKIIQDNFHGYRFNPNQVEGIFNPQSILYYLKQLLQKETGINDENVVNKNDQVLRFLRKHYKSGNEYALTKFASGSFHAEVSTGMRTADLFVNSTAELAMVTQAYWHGLLTYVGPGHGNELSAPNAVIRDAVWKLTMESFSKEEDLKQIRFARSKVEEVRLIVDPIARVAKMVDIAKDASTMAVIIFKAIGWCIWNNFAMLFFIFNLKQTTTATWEWTAIWHLKLEFAI